METKTEKWSHSVVKRSGCRYTNGRLHSLPLQRFSFVGQGSSLEALPPALKNKGPKLQRKPYDSQGFTNTHIHLYLYIYTYIHSLFICLYRNTCLCVSTHLSATSMSTKCCTCHEVCAAMLTKLRLPAPRDLQRTCRK